MALKGHVFSFYVLLLLFFFYLKSLKLSLHPSIHLSHFSIFIIKASISPSAGHVYPGSPLGSPVVSASRQDPAAWWGPATPCCPGPGLTGPCWVRTRRNRRKTALTCPWVRRAAGPWAGPAAPPSGPACEGLTQTASRPASPLERLPADCLWPGTIDRASTGSQAWKEGLLGPAGAVWTGRCWLEGWWCWLWQGESWGETPVSSDG